MGVTIKDLSSYNSINSINFGEKVLFFKFGADWCIPCVELDKILMSVPGSMLYNISVENEDFNSFFMDNKIYAVPDTIIKYKNSTTRFQGVRTLDQILEMIEKLKEAAA
tara:strand:+ start:4442 stop:4768 length:327 start_codon:yes stop_codon:yes gene_type:complete